MKNKQNNNIYGLVGEKLGHSFSKQIHNLLGNNNYELYPLSKNEFTNFAQNREFSAINVTIPYKKDIIPFCDFIDDKAKKIGAVNTVVNKNGKLHGYNTDYDGFKFLVEKNGINLKDENIIIIGTGGTSLTAKAVCLDSGAKKVIRLSRKNNDKSNDIITYEQLKQTEDSINIIINTTPVGMFPNVDKVPADFDLGDKNRFRSLRAVIDVIYNPLNTKLIFSAKERGLKTASGLTMLVAQAVFANFLFFDIEKPGFEKIALDIEKIENIILKEKRNICLIGMPGCGKSTIGKELSKILKMDFFDCDEEIEKEQNQKISEIFSQRGENYFRYLEKEMIKKLSVKNNIIISTGGGMIKSSENITNLSLNSIIIFIDRPLKNLDFGTSRPLSSNFKDLENLYEQRYPVYNKACNKKVINDADLEKVIKQILELID